MSNVIDELISARAALVRMREVVHFGNDECGPMCADYHDAMRAVTWAAEAIGMTVHELDLAARHHNHSAHGFVEAWS